jgi:transcription initiation factor IIF auxiliary subunit
MHDGVNEMAIRLRNRWRYKEDNWWEWKAFLDDEGSGELDQVDFVEYVLHPTFHSTVRRVDNPEGGFVLKTAGWGVFELKAFVYLKNGEKKKLTHQLELSHDPPEGISN